MKTALRNACWWLMMGCMLANSGAAKHKKRGGQQNAAGTPGQFDFYLLNLSWAPEFCATHPNNQSSSECDPSRHYGFVVHGLWPQYNSGNYPKECAPAQPVSQQIVQHMLMYIPARGLIQHEWAEHGTCSGLSQEDYFAQVEQAFKKIQVPVIYQHPSQSLNVSLSDMEQKFADANQAPKGAFRVSCSNGEFVALEACFSRDLQLQDCGSAARECSAPQVLVRPTP
jgi:ribonuclease T2